MRTMKESHARPFFHRAEDVRVSELEQLVDIVTPVSDIPLHAEIEKEVVIFERSALLASDDAERILANVLHGGTGAFIVRHAFASEEELATIDAATHAFSSIIAEEEVVADGKRGDHFAKAGANSRIWNALEKLGVAAPDVFVRYYANPVIALASRAWLGPSYQVTSQVNVVKPGGHGQRCHRDYHLGFQDDATAARYPSHVHELVSPMLTLQGAVAHCDMPVESGPTQLLPHSHKFAAGYVSWRREDVRTLFESRAVQLPLYKGDALFFNPSLLHAAGGNSSQDINRMANLLQVSSAFGRPMESVDRHRLSVAIYPALLRAGLNEQSTANAIAACADGYPFPTNLDRDQPIGGLAPPSQADVLTKAVKEQWGEQRLLEELEAYSRRHRSMG